MSEPLVPTTPGSLDAHELESTLGVLFIGYIMMMTGYGFTFFQTYVYSSYYPKDSWAIKSVVITLCAIDTATSSLMSQALYYYLITLFPFTAGLDDATPTFLAELTLSIIAVYLVQLFYTYRIWILSNNAIVSGTIAMISTTAFALGIAMASGMVHHTSFIDPAKEQIKAISAASQFLTFVSALGISCSLCFYLRPSQNASMKPYKNWFDKLIALALNRGIAAAIVQLAYFVVYVAMPSKQIWIPFHLVASKLFINSLFTMLNSREIRHGKGLNEEDSVDSKRTAGNSSESSGAVGHVSGIRFNVVRSKAEVQTPINITVTSGIEEETASGRKVITDDHDDEENIDVFDEQDSRKQDESSINSG